jgi:hypothetical protein
LPGQPADMAAQMTQLHCNPARLRAQAIQSAAQAV